METKTYTRKSTATRAVKGFAEEFTINGDKESGFAVVVTCRNEAETEAARAKGFMTEDLYPEEAPAKKSKSGYIRGSSTIGGACAMVHGIATEMAAENPDVSRKEIMAACMAAGVTYGTARTQYQKWKENQK